LLFTISKYMNEKSPKNILFCAVMDLMSAL
jgi:hypothetical protein